GQLTHTVGAGPLTRVNLATTADATTGPVKHRGLKFCRRAHRRLPAGRPPAGPPFARPRQNSSLLPLRTAAGAAPPARGLGAGWAGRDEYAAMGKVVLQVKSLATVSRSIHRLPARAM